MKIEEGNEDSFIKDLGLGTDSEEENTDNKNEEQEKESTEEKGKESEEKDLEEEESEEEENEEKEESEEESEGKEEEEEKEESEEESEKDLTKEEIKKLPKDVRGMYHALKKERGKRQDIEAELGQIKLQIKYGNKKTETEKEEPEEKDFETVEDILKDKADDDLISVGEQRRIKISENKEREFQARKQSKVTEAQAKAHANRVAQIDELEDTFKLSHSDYDEKLNIFQAALRDMPSLAIELNAEYAREGGNPAKKVYELGKRFEKVYDKTVDSKPKKKPNNAERTLKNSKKKVSSASISSSGVSAEALSEMDVKELGKTLAAMSMKQLMRVPKKLREKALRA